VTFEDIIKLLGLLGGIAVAITLVWRLIDVRKAYLHISLTVKDLPGSRVKLRTEVKNTNTLPRKLDAAFLVIGPACDTPHDTIMSLFKSIDESDAVAKLREVVGAITKRLKRDTSEITDKSGRMIIPLTYYFEENLDVADEELSYEHIIDCTGLPPGPYSARFYIEGIPWLHRVVHASFEVLPPASSNRAASEVPNVGS
jgi:hypothetical protein